MSEMSCASTSKFHKFTDFVTWLDSLKQLYCLSEHIIRDDRRTPESKQQARKFQQVLDSFSELSVPQVVRYIHDAEDLNTMKGRVRIRSKLCLARKFAAIIESCSYSDETFYHEAGLGKSWNEVENPPFVQHLFDYQASCLASSTPGLLGSEGCVTTKELCDGSAAVSYYNLGDMALVFENIRAAELFAQKNPVSPSTRMVFHNGSWETYTYG